MHFVKSKTVVVVTRGDSWVLATAKIRADKQIAHLTKKRFADGAREK